MPWRRNRRNKKPALWGKCRFCLKVLRISSLVDHVDDEHPMEFERYVREPFNRYKQLDEEMERSEARHIY